MATKKTAITFGNGKKELPEIKTKKIRLEDLAKGFVDTSDDEDGSVTTMDGQVNLRPSYQRNYVHEGFQDVWVHELVRSIANGMPINPVYFGIAENGYEVIDGQQRCITCAALLNGDVTIFWQDENGVKHNTLFNGLPDGIKETIKNYELQVNVCEGTEEQRLNWFQVINQKASTLEDQELRNATYHGPFVEALKKAFVWKKSPILAKGNIYNPELYIMSNKDTRIRQGFVELALEWISYYEWKNGKNTGEDSDQRIRNYMGVHKNDNNADEVVAHYKKVIDWARDVFHKEYIEQKCAKNVEWGRLYAEYGNASIDKEYVNREADRLFSDEEVKANSAVFEYVLMGCPLDKKNMLSLRAFQNNEKLKLYRLQNGIDPIDGKPYPIEEMQAHHIDPWENGGKTEIENGVLISKENHTKFAHGGTLNRFQIKALKDELLDCVKNGKPYNGRYSS